MSLTPGTRLGVFDVLGLLGQGGMGQVYRARDSRLKRDVALKVLPEGFATDAERVARFQREAEILATLTHQNIAAIYGLEESDGVRALVMELGEGETLAARIARGPMPVDEALPLARQLAEALDYAHEKGVLHRDLKPANITVTPDGQVKVLDFGLAKALGAPAAASGPVGSPEHSPTITSPAFTQAGMILGTAAYMAPEQVRGRAVDKRADIWAFGCVLYEMLTGARAFDGDTVSDTLAAVLKSDPDWTRLPASVPGRMRELLQLCLARDPKTRIRDIADAQLVVGGTLLSSSAAPPAARERQWRGVAIAALSAALLLAAGWYSSRSEPSLRPGPVRQVTVQLPAVLPQSAAGSGPALALARDGSVMAFSARSGAATRLFVHRFADATTTAVRGPVFANSPVFSPDGRALAFAVDNSVWRAALDGGEAEVLCSAPEAGGFRGGAWGENGRIVFAAQRGLFQVGEPGGACRLALATDPAREARFLWPQVLAGGRGILFTVSGVSDDADGGSIVVVKEGTTERRVVVRGARAGRVTTSGHLVFARGHQILAAPFDLDRLSVTADPIVIVDGVAMGLYGGPVMSVSDLGDFVYAQGEGAGNRLVWVTRNGNRSDAGAPRRSYQPQPRLSPRGRHVTVPIGTGDHFMWLYAFETGTLTPLSDWDLHATIWSPDGRMVAYPVDGPGLAIRSLETMGEPDVVALDGAPRVGITALTWSPDGATIVYSRGSPVGPVELVALRLRDKTSSVLFSSQRSIQGTQFSPDGRWLAYASDESGRFEVYVTDFPAAKVKKPVSTEGGTAPAWSPDGRELFYLNETRMMAAAVGAGSPITFERPVPLFDGIELATAATPYSVAPDGRFLFVEEVQAEVAHRSQLRLVLNWFEELNRRVPVHRGLLP